MDTITTESDYFKLYWAAIDKINEERTATDALLHAIKRLADDHECHGSGGLCNEDHAELWEIVTAAIARAEKRGSWEQPVA